jgi:hypothetical protein
VTDQEIPGKLQALLNSQDADELAETIGNLRMLKGRCDEKLRRQLLRSFALRLAKVLMAEHPLLGKE